MVWLVDKFPCGLIFRDKPCKIEEYTARSPLCDFFYTQRTDYFNFFIKNEP